MEKKFFVYLMASKKEGVLYTGVTSDLLKRAYEHRMGLVEGFTKKYFVKRLVYFEPHEDIENAIKREKQIKAWKRNWKVSLIEELNPNWNDLYDNLLL